LQSVVAEFDHVKVAARTECHVIGIGKLAGFRPVAPYDSDNLAIK
jgi:hypothetical protein